MSTHKVFVYGTLRRKRKATHAITGKLFLINSGNFSYPAVRLEGDASVYGNVLEVDDDQLAELDKYESIANGLYTRQRVSVVEIETKTHEEMWVYVGGDVLFPTPIASGDWFNR